MPTTIPPNSTGLTGKFYPGCKVRAVEHSTSNQWKQYLTIGKTYTVLGVLHRGVNSDSRFPNSAYNLQVVSNTGLNHRWPSELFEPLSSPEQMIRAFINKEISRRDFDSFLEGVLTDG